MALNRVTFTVKRTRMNDHEANKMQCLVLGFAKSQFNYYRPSLGNNVTLVSVSRTHIVPCDVISYYSTPYQIVCDTRWVTLRNIWRKHLDYFWTDRENKGITNKGREIMFTKYTFHLHNKGFLHLVLASITFEFKLMADGCKINKAPSTAEESVFTR